MGVHGLWRLIEPSGKPVPLETLENKVLAVDISIWLHQCIKGFQDSKGASVPNAHLLGIYHRLCKLLYFRIKPIFVFDGGVPALKKQTIAKRNESKSKLESEASRLQKQLLNVLLKHTAVSKVLTDKIEASIASVPKPTKQDAHDMYKLPPNPTELDSTLSESEDESESYSDTTTDSSPSKNWDVHTIDMNSIHFKSLPVDVRHEILSDLKETRKQSSWGRIHELPTESIDFATYQMKRLLKRQAVQSALEDAEKEMGGKCLSLGELELVLKDEGVLTNDNVGNRIASDNVTKYVLLKDLKAMKEENLKVIQEDVENESEILTDSNTKIKSKADIEYEQELEKAIVLSLEEPMKDKKDVKTTEEEKIKDIQKNIEVKCEETLTAPNTNINKVDIEYDEELQKAIALSLEEPMKDKKILKITEEEKFQGIQENIELKSETLTAPNTKNMSKVDIEYEELQKAIALSLDEPVKDKKLSSTKKINPAEFSFLKDFKEADFELSSSDEETEPSEPLKKVVSSVHGYMQEYSGLTPSEIDKIMNNNLRTNQKSSKCDFNNLKLAQDVSSHTSLENTTKLIQNVSGFLSSKNNSPVQEANKNIQEKMEIEFMSSSDSDTDGDETGQKRNSGLEINIDVNEEYHEQDDLFSDIFNGDISLKNPTKNTEDKNIMENIEQIIPSDEEKAGNTNQIIVPNSMIQQDTLSEVSLQENKQEQKEDQENLKKDDEKQEILTEKRNPQEQLTSEQLVALKDELDKEKTQLQIQKSTKERIASNISDKIYQEAQELLELFGVPYIIAPMEAEAQCAFLEQIELTNGTVTDDSDIWLFGAQTVYKNFFNENKYVKEFRAENIKHHFKLTRDQMILFALLVGSDYTVGLQGVGPVTAMEILSCFPPSSSSTNEFHLSQSDLLSGLKEFRSWFSKGKSTGPGRNVLKNKLRNVKFTENFPSVQVVRAYLEPCVETSNESFSWGKPNGSALIEYAVEKFGWTKMKSEQILNPVLKRLNEIKHQKSITDYFKSKYKIHSGDATNGLSKRVKSAITNMGRDPSEIIAEELESAMKKTQKRRPKKGGNDSGTTAPEFATCNSDETVSEYPNKKIQKKRPKKADDSGTTAPEFTKDTPTSQKKPPKKEASISGAIAPEFTEGKSAEISTTVVSRKRTNKPPLQTIEEKKPRGKSVQKLESNSQTLLQKGEPDEGDDISQKIKSIRNRRLLKQAKTPEVRNTKAKQKGKVPKNQLEVIPDNLKDDDEVSLLSKVLLESNEKVKEITKSVKNDIDRLNRQPIPSTSSRPTVIPKKLLIPQKEKDKNMLLRNKLKAIETFRKSKRGPGFVPKKGKNKRSPKENADLSESNSD